jgi:hypothetical protein
MRPARQIERDPRQGLVHRNMGRAVTPHTAALGKRPAQGLADCYADVFNRVMHIDVKVAVRLNFEVDQGMACEKRQHMIEETYASRDAVGAVTIQTEGNFDACFPGLAL